MGCSPKEKSMRKGLRGSITRRLFFISLIFLIIPLLIYALIMQRQEYHVKTRDVFHSLEFLIQGQKEIIQDFISTKLRLINVVADFIDDPMMKQKTYEDMFLLLANKKLKSTAFFLEKKEDGSWICEYSSLDQMRGKSFNQYIDLQKYESNLLQDDTFVVLKEASNFFPKSILLGKLMHNNMGRMKGLLLLSIPADSLLEKARILRLPDYPSSLSFLDKKNRTFVSSNENFVGKSPELYLRQGVMEGYEFSLEKQNYLAIKADLKGMDFSLLLVTPAYVIFQELKKYIVIFALFLVFILCVGGVGTFLFMLRYSKPLEQLSVVMDKVGSGDLTARYKQDRLGFEINTVGSLFNTMVDSLITHIEQVKDERTKNAALTRELHLGQQVQQSLLPKQMPHFPTEEFASRCLSAKEVGGDFFDVLVKEFEQEDKILLTVADASGKGIFACFYSLSVRSILRSYGFATNDLREIIMKTNHLFCKDTRDSGVFVTSWVGIYDRKTKQLDYCSCGHLPALLKKSDGKVHKLNTPGIALGVIEIEGVQTESVQLERGDFLILYSDGITEAENNNGEMFKETRLISTIEEAKVDHAEDLVGHILEKVTLFSEGAAQSDDITLLVMRVK